MNVNAFPALPLPMMITPLKQINYADLSTKSEADQKQQIGEEIYPFIEQIYGTALAGKITGAMLIAPVNQLVMYLQNRDLFFQTAHNINVQFQQSMIQEAQAQVVSQQPQ